MEICRLQKLVMQAVHAHADKTFQQEPAVPPISPAYIAFTAVTTWKVMQVYRWRPALGVAHALAIGKSVWTTFTNAHSKVSGTVK